MKTRNYLKIFSSVFFFAFIIASFSSCTKDDGASVSGSANLMIVNGAEGSAPQDYYVDNAKVTGSAVAYTQNSGYITTNAGDHQGQFRTTGTATANATTNLSMESGKYYTVYLTGSGNSSTAITTTDDMSAPPAGKAKVRFVHLSSAVASSIDLAVSGGSKIVSGLTYQTASAYNNIDANTSLTISVAGSSNTLLTIPAVLVQPGKIYTVFISGATATSLSFNVIAQK